MKYLGLDLGKRRVGVAVSDPDGKVAVPLTVIDRRVVSSLAQGLVPIMAEYAVDALVVGLPIRTDGTEGVEAQEARRVAGELERFLGCPVSLYDERLTTRIAHAAGREVGVRNKKRKKSVDMVAASLILQGWLDRHQNAVS